MACWLGTYQGVSYSCRSKVGVGAGQTWSAAKAQSGHEYVWKVPYQTAYRLMHVANGGAYMYFRGPAYLVHYWPW